MSPKGHKPDKKVKILVNSLDFPAKPVYSMLRGGCYKFSHLRHIRVSQTLGVTNIGRKDLGIGQIAGFCEIGDKVAGANRALSVLVSEGNFYD
jgi:hypothetical protein